MSKRQERKAARGGGLSRPNRRAARRLAIALAGYEIACRVSKTPAAFTKPGSHKCW